MPYIKLTESNKEAIMHHYGRHEFTQAQLAEKYNVSIGTINKTVTSDKFKTLYPNFVPIRPKRQPLTEAQVEQKRYKKMLEHLRKFAPEDIVTRLPGESADEARARHSAGLAEQDRKAREDYLKMREEYIKTGKQPPY